MAGKTADRKLLTELPGILNWAIAGWARLDGADFKQPASAKEAMEQLEDLASPIGAFLRERCDIGAAYSVVSKLFGAWKTWCEAQGRDRPGTIAELRPRPESRASGAEDDAAQRGRKAAPRVSRLLAQTCHRVGVTRRRARPPTFFPVRCDTR